MKTHRAGTRLSFFTISNEGRRASRTGCGHRGAVMASARRWWALACYCREHQGGVGRTTGDQYRQPGMDWSRSDSCRAVGAHLGYAESVGDGLHWTGCDAGVSGIGLVGEDAEVRAESVPGRVIGFALRHRGQTKAVDGAENQPGSDAERDPTAGSDVPVVAGYRLVNLGRY